MTAWSKLLVATTRLLDLHDSGHEPGSPFVHVSQESRRGLRDGYWLDLGCLLLDYLLDVDFATNSAFVSQTRCLAHLREFYPELAHDDLGFVVNLLAKVVADAGQVQASDGAGMAASFPASGAPPAGRPRKGGRNGASGSPAGHRYKAAADR